MTDPGSRPDRPRFAPRRCRVVALPTRRARRAHPTPFDALERRGLMSVAPTPAGVLPVALGEAGGSSGGVAVVAVSRPITSLDPGAKPTSIGKAMFPRITLDPSSPQATPPSGMANLPEPATVQLPEIAGLRPNLGIATAAPVAVLGGVPASSSAGPRPNPSPLPIAKVAMAEAEYSLNGAVVREFAFADQAKDQITVRNGDVGPEVIGTHDDGVRSPDDIKLIDLNGDTIKDLVVANSGANNVLIFPGLDGGRFATESNGGRGIAVGAAPAGITVGDVDGDGIPDMVIANRGSNDISLLLGRGQPAGWSFQDGGRLRAGVAPVASLVADVDHDGLADILVCNSGSNTVTVLRGLGNGRFDDQTPRVLAVGDGPVQMFLGRFDNRPEPELLTVNSRSNDLTLISDLLGDQPSTETIASGGLAPTSAFASDLDSDGFTDLIVANTGDGKLALFQGGDAGLSLTSLVTAPTLPTPTAILAGNPTSDGFDVFAVSAGQDAASILHFDLGLATEVVGFAPIVPALTRGGKSEEDDPSAQLVSHGDSAFNLVGILGLSSSSGDAEDNQARDDRDAETGRINRSRNGGQSLDDEEEYLDAKSASDELPRGPGLLDAGDPSDWTRFVLGLEEALGEVRKVAVQAIAEEESGPGLALDDLALLDLTSAGASTPADLDPASAADEALREIGSEGAAEPAEDAPPVSDSGTGRVESIPTVSLGLILAHQALIRVAPTRRPRIRKPPASRPKSDGGPRAGMRRA